MNEEYSASYQASTDELVLRLNDLWKTSSSASETVSHNKWVDHLELKRPLGAGTFGVVYLAHDSRLNRSVAVKLPRPEVILDQEKWNRFAREGEIAAQLSHPGIVRIYEARLSGTTPYIVSEYCKGMDLACWLESIGDPSWTESVGLVIEIAKSVQYAHEMGVLHRDLKPANVMLVARNSIETPEQLSDYEARITDFGLAHFSADSMKQTRSTVVLGTPYYIAPEAFSRGDRLTPAADVFSLGVILYELLSGSLPFDGENYTEIVNKTLNSHIRPLKSKTQQLPPSLKFICLKCLERNPKDRYQSAAELAVDLQRCLKGAPPIGKRVTLISRIRNWCEHSDRVTDAGRLTIFAQIFMNIWTYSTLIMATSLGLIRDAQMPVTIIEVLSLSFFVGIPQIYLGWKIIQRKRWAVWFCFISVLSSFPLVVMGILNMNVLFKALYDGNPFLSFVTHVMLVLFQIMQLLMYWCSLRVLSKE